MIKFKLDQESLTNDFFFNTRLLGVIAPMKNYLFCWKLNNALGVNFVLSQEREILLKRKKRDYFFNIYKWKEPENYVEHIIYHNHYDGEYLLPEFRNMDFLWLMKGDIVDDEKCNYIQSVVNKISGVQLIAELTNEKIKNKNNMIFN